MEDKLKHMLNLLTRIFSNDVISMPFKTADGGSYLIEYHRTQHSMQDSLTKTTRWRVTDNSSQITFAPRHIVEMLKVLNKLEVDLNVVHDIVDHHLVMSVGWHDYCMQTINSMMGEGYTTKCLDRRTVIVNEIASLVREMAKGKDVSEQLSDTLLTGRLPTVAPRLTLVERGDDD